MDRQWWEVHLNEINAVFRGARFTINPVARKFQATKLGPIGFDAYGNSGAGAISLAAQGNPKRIILLGYDCQKTGGKAHWHGDHPPTLGNAGQIDRWHTKFAKQAKELTGVEIINCSRVTALICWPRANLEDVLHDA
jgi:hypothetical protein